MTNIELANLLRAAKLAESMAKTERLRIEALVTEQFTKPANNEGTLGDDFFKVTYKVNRSVDSDSLSSEFEDLPANAQKAFRWKAEVNTTVLRSLADLDPAAYSKAAKYITSNPAKPSIELKD